MAGIIKKRPCPCCKKNTAKGLANTTFGGVPRFSRKNITFHGSQSAFGSTYYANSPFWTSRSERGRCASFGVSDRPTNVRGMHNCGPTVGPQTYDYKLSFSRSTSALDGAEFANTSLKPRRAYCVGQPSQYDQAQFPGPGYYPLKSTVGDALKYSIRFPLVDVDSGGGDSIMKLKGDLDDTPLWSFSKGERTVQTVPNSSPSGQLYYANNNKGFSAKDLSCSFGIGNRMSYGNTDYDAAPGSYELRKDCCPRCDSEVDINAAV